MGNNVLGCKYELGSLLKAFEFEISTGTFKCCDKNKILFNTTYLKIFMTQLLRVTSCN